MNDAFIYELKTPLTSLLKDKYKNEKQSVEIRLKKN